MKGVYFDTLHSYRDFNLILSAVNIPPATPKTNYISVEGADGSLDLTETLGEVKYKDRTGSLTFSVLPEDNFEQKKSEISNIINGHCFFITLEKDMEYYYIGRCSINSYKEDKKLRQIVVGMQLHPYKYKQNITVVEATAGTVTLKNDRKSVVPSITVTEETTLTFKGNEYTLNAGKHKILDIQLLHGDNEITIDSAGTVTFEYQEGSL